MRWMLLALALASSAALLGCARPYTVIGPTAGDVLEGAAEFAVHDVDTSAVARGERSAEEVLAEKGYVDGPREISRRFSAYLRLHASREGVPEIHRDPGAAPFVLRPRIERMEPGYRDLVTGEPSRLTLLVSVEDRHGRVLETIRVESSTEVEIGRTLARETYDRDLRELARALAAYLGDRIRTSPHPASW